MHDPPARPEMQSTALWLAAAMAIAAAFAYGLLATWPLGTHGDEWKKVDFVLSGEQDFMHPILMLQLARLANGIAGLTEPSRLLVLGRSLAAAFGGLLVFATFLLGRRFVSPPVALSVAAAIAVCPLVAVHSTFFKEDVFLAAPIVLAVAALVRLTDRPSRARSLVLGLAVGVAASAKYVGAIALPFAVVTLCIATKVGLRERLRMAAIVTGAAIATFAVINVPLFTELAGFRRGLGYEVAHVVTGHDVRLPIGTTFGVLHLLRSLAPGLGAALLGIGLLGIAAPIVDREQRRPLAIVLCMAALWYALHEASPLKPFPDFERYMVPLAPFLLVLGAAFVESVARRATPRHASLVASLIVTIAALPALYRSYLVLDAARVDPRSAIPKIAHSLGANPCFDRYASFDHVAIEAAALDPFVTSAPPNVLVTSNFLLDRFVIYGRRGAQSAAVGRAQHFYERMLAKPHLVITNGGPSYAFLNPVLYVVAVDGDLGRLHAIAVAIRSAEPRLSIAIGP